VTAAVPRVLVVDDHPPFRRVACELIEARGYAVVGEAGDANEARSAAARLAPDAVLLDVRLGDDSGFDLCRELTRAQRGLAVLLVSSCDLGALGGLVRDSGARGFVAKSGLPRTDLAAFWPAPPENRAA
jgi:DNA-binding NarL/FixJ family response regulator